ncbi:MAG: DUF3179 domain-containing protein [Caldilineaceae bacterium]|nr:DUF3179 domain-containing protein [Caldilineaceae bacterium]
MRIKSAFKAFILPFWTLLLLMGMASACSGPARTPLPTAEAPETGETAQLSDASPPFSTQEWTTDFSKRTVEWREILAGGPPKDGIPAIDHPGFEPITQASDWLTERDPVLVFRAGEEVRAYPLAILIWHEIVNDAVNGTPVAVTFCPLCNAGIVFERRLNGMTLDFGTTGKLRNSDLIMYDRQTESWWQQVTGEAIVGELTGAQLTFLPAQVLSFSDLAAVYPQAQVLARPASGRRYGDNPYEKYDSTTDCPFLYAGELDDRLPVTERVVGVELDGTAVAYPFAAAAARGVINDQIGKTPIVVFHKEGTASALDARVIAQGRDVGSTGVFDRRVDGQTLTFRANEDGTFTDAETGSAWTITGEATDGPLQGKTLKMISAFEHFWFAWNAFFPRSEIYQTE